MLRDAPQSGGLASKQALAEIEAALFDRPSRPVTLSRYVLLDRIGAGGSGLVLRAYDPELDRKIAIKLLQTPRRSADIDTDGRLRLLREAQALARLSHPNVIAVHDVGTYTEDDLGGTVASADVPPRGVFMVMELVDGPTLRGWMAEPHTWREALDVMVPAAEGLIAAHAQELVHRDFKPANVLVGSDGRVRVLDFGLARQTGHSGGFDRPPPFDSDERTSDRLTRSGLVMGTPLYMAPEQHIGAEATERSDQFSFCACLYEIVYRTRPFEGHGLDALLSAKRRGPRPPPAIRRVPGRLRSAILRGLSPAPEDRFASMVALRDQLERVRSQRRRMVTVASVAGLGILGVVAVRLAAPDDACRAHLEQLAGVWDEARRDALHEGFAASGVSSADEAWEHTAALVDAYAEDWTHRRHEACRAALTGESPPDVMEAKVQCLDRRLSGLRETLDVLGGGDSDTVRNAATAVAQLTPLSTCDGDLERHDALPSAGPRRERALEVARRLDRARALKVAGRFEAAHAEVDAAVTLATESEHAPSEVRSWIERANLRQRMGKLDDAADDTQRALVAAERSGQRFLVDEVLVWRVAFDGYLRSRHEIADGLVEQLEARFSHEAPTPKVRANFEKAVALLRNDEGRLEDALVHVRAALDLHAHLRPAQVANALNLEANVLLSQGKLEAAREGHERALVRRRALFGDTHGDTAQSIANLALVDQLSGDLDAAIAGLERSLAIQREMWGHGHVNLAPTLNNLGVTWGKKGDIDKAYEYFRRAHVLFLERYGQHHVVTGRGHANLAAMLNNLGRFEEALEQAQWAMSSLDEIVEPDHIARSEALFASGLAKIGLGRKDEGLREIEQARTIYERQEVRDPARERYLYTDFEDVSSGDG